MPLQNRVQPTGEFLATPARGSLMGNRGILHDSLQRLGSKRWQHKAWVTCKLAFKDRRRPLMQPGNYTELFFHDEAVAFAAGHRPCGECRRDDYSRFRSALDLRPPISTFDTKLHAARAVPLRFEQRRTQSDIGTLPDGTFILLDDGTACLLDHDRLLPFSPAGYGPALHRPRTGLVTVLTPAPLVRAIAAGYRLDIARA